MLSSNKATRLGEALTVMTARRNDPCSCGSGKKFKRCHLLIEQQEIIRQPPQRTAVEFAGRLLGKRIFVRPDVPHATVSDLKRQLSRFNLAWFLRMVGGAGADLSSDNYRDIGGVIASSHALRYIGLVAIEASSDAHTLIPQPQDIAQAVRTFDGLPVMVPSSESDDTLEYLVRMAYAEFAGRDGLHSMIARTWIIYDRLWLRVEKARTFDVDHAIRLEAGLSLQHLMFFGFSYLGDLVRRRDGHFRPYSDEGLRALPPALGIGRKEHEAFLSFVTASYGEIRRLASLPSSRPRLDQYNLSPFLLKPVVIPDSPPAEAEGILLVPVPHFLALRTTQGVYHMLATAGDAGGSRNSFRVAFGHVFEHYVGELLRAGSGGCPVLSEVEYGSRKARRKSPDWFVLDGTHLVAIEVKQSALFLNSKVNGSLRGMSEDLRKTLIKASEQLIAFHKALMAREHGLEVFRDVTDVQLLVVTFDDLAWPNSIMRDLIASEIEGAGEIHFCTIGDLENLQRYCWGESPFELLASKTQGRASKFDFREWLAELRNPDKTHPLLDSVFRDLVALWGVPLSD